MGTTNILLMVGDILLFLILLVLLRPRITR